MQWLRKLPRRLYGRYEWLVRELCLVFFRLLQRLRVTVVPNHFEQPIPDLGALRPGYWDEVSELPGIDLRLGAQLELLAELRAGYAAEYDALPRDPTGVPHQFYLRNGGFGSVDAEVYYALLRHLRPGRVVEIGCGHSTFLATGAALRNQAEGAPCELVAIDPYLMSPLDQGFPGLARVRQEKVEEIPVAELVDLEPGDVFFIDSSHVLTFGSDVQHLFLEVLPRLPPGVLVHVHDIFLPARYPKSWTDRMLRFFNEQDLLQAFLAHNPRAEVVWAGQAMHRAHPEALAESFASYGPRVSPGSFWFRIRGP